MKRYNAVVDGGLKTRDRLVMPSDALRASRGGALLAELRRRLVRRIKTLLPG